MEYQNFNEKNMLTDLLETQKQLTGAYNVARLESVTPSVLSCFDEISEDEHRIQRGIFNIMHERGMYPTPAADDAKVAEVKETYGQKIQA